MLVITIIVIIILAAAVILTLNNTNPISEANSARYESDVANMQAIFTNTVVKVMAKNQATIVVEAGELNSIKSGGSSIEGRVNYVVNDSQNSSNTNGTIVFNTGNNTNITYYTGKMLPLYESGKTTWYVDEEGVISLQVGKEKYGSGMQLESKNLSKEFIDINGKKATIPAGFYIVPEKNVIKNGLVISDVENDTEDIGNQFVWIPVDDMNSFVREEGYQLTTTGELFLQKGVKEGKYTEPLNYNVTVASEDEIKEYENLMKSIEEYHGFYIGRYEISNNGEDKVQSKRGAIPWADIKFSNSMTDLSGGIVEKIREMYPENTAKKGSAVSTLVYGICYDETVRFIRKNYLDVEENSMNYGNLLGTNGNVVIPTGSKEEYALNNIYDIVGNVGEFTMEAYYDYARISRGGVFVSNF